MNTAKTNLLGVRTCGYSERPKEKTKSASGPGRILNLHTARLTTTKSEVLQVSVTNELIPLHHHCTCSWLNRCSHLLRSLKTAHALSCAWSPTQSSWNLTRTTPRSAFSWTPKQLAWRHSFNCHSECPCPYDYVNTKTFTVPKGAGISAYTTE